MEIRILKHYQLFVGGNKFMKCDNKKTPETNKKKQKHIDKKKENNKIQWFFCPTGHSPLGNSAIPHQWGIPHRLRTTV